MRSTKILNKMIEEQLSGAALTSGDTKISTNNGPAGVLAPLITTSHSSVGPSSFSSSSSHPSTTTTTTSAASAAANSENQNLRCPRCDSSNTKFCYYNNYNLTQPRHFCKTCRRYWTKGGALRNVPIGGGCRKSRNVGGGASNSVVKTSVAKMKTAAPSELERSVLGVAAGFIDHGNLSPNTILWGSPQSSPHLLALLRTRQNHNHNHNPNPNPSLPIAVNKEEGNNLMGSHTVTEPVLGNGLVHGRALNFEPVDQFPTLGLCSSMWRSTNSHNNNNNQDGFVVGELGIQELYQRLRSSSSQAANYCSDNNNSSQVLGNMASSSLSANLASGSVVSGDDQLGYTWNPTLSWFDLSTTNNGTLYP